MCVMYTCNKLKQVMYTIATSIKIHSLHYGNHGNHNGCFIATKISKLFYACEYSGTSDSGLSEIGTLYNKPLYKGHCLRSQK